MSGASQTTSDLRELQSRLAGAEDNQIERVVAMVDALPKRGYADRLVAPLRPRLAQLRPPRPLRFCRLLFLPADPLIVPAPEWRPASLTIPRTALEPLAVSVRDAMSPGITAAVEAMIANRTTRDSEIVRRAGAILWPAAGKILSAAPASRTWNSTGLPTYEHRALARAIGAVVTHGVMLREIVDACREGHEPDKKQIETLLSRASPHGPETVSRVITVLLDHMPKAAAMLMAMAGVAFTKCSIHGRPKAETERGIGGRIRVARRGMGWTQQVLADTVGVSRSAVAQWETNRTLGTPGTLTRLARALGTSVEWLMLHGTEANPLEESGSQDELSILQLYRNCSTEERLVVRHMLERFAGKRND
jgi:transcriptional regulator with XRE-family HTH domain